MREPTPRHIALAWWKTALSGGATLITDEPHCGFFKRRLVKDGPFVPARIWLDSEADSETGELITDERFQCEVNGQYADPYDAWSWLCARPISEAEFRYMEALRDHARMNEPDHPAADPRKPIDNLRTPILF